MSGGQENNHGTRFSRRSFITGAALGAAAGAAAVALPRKFFRDPARPEFLSEYYVNGFWLESAGFEDQPPNKPLLERKLSADIAIIGGGFTGLASAYHLAKRFPSKKIIVLETARCGFGASGRNGGQALPVHPVVEDIYKKEGVDAAKKFANLNRQGLEIIRSYVKDHGVQCDMEENGVLVLAYKEQDLEGLSKSHEIAKAMGRESRLLSRDEVKRELKSDRYFGGWRLGDGAILNPARLALGLKSVVESLGVQVFERTKVMSLTPGSKVRLETEFGEVQADAVVIGTNGYTQKLGLFKHRFAPLCNYVVATEPLSPAQVESIGWKGREAMWDTRTEFDYIRLSADNRIVIGGEHAPYFYGSGLSGGNYKPSLEMLEQSILKTWPQLAGVKVTHRWGGTMAFTLNFLPFIGVTGESKNIFYSLGYSGEGVCWSQLAGKIISELYAREETDLTKLLVVNHLPPYIPSEPLRYAGVTLYERLFK
jgi:glycine/D-amino acid oxidase-like deaminating enzyme